VSIHYATSVALTLIHVDSVDVAAAANDDAMDGTIEDVAVVIDVAAHFDCLILFINNNINTGAVM
jgi:hypothetical protein